MWKPIYQPEPWPQFVKRKDIIALPLMEQRKKFMQETILFENYLSTLNTVNTVNSSVASSAAAGGGGPAPGGGGDPSPSPTPGPNLPLNNLSLSVVSAAGLRQLTSSYSGPLIRVRRNDETELDIAFIPSSGDLDTGSLINFVGTGSSDIGRVTKMYNQSGRPSIPYTYSSGGVLVTGQLDLDWISENRGITPQYFAPPVIIVSGTLNRNQDGKVFLASNSDANYDDGTGNFFPSYMNMKVIGSDQASTPYYESGLISGDNIPSRNPGRYRSLYVVAQMDPQNNTEANYVDKYSVGYILGLDTENNTPQLDNKRIGFKVAGYGTDAFSDMFNPYLKPYFSFGTVPTGSDANDNVLVLNTASYAAPGSNGVQGIGYVAGTAQNPPSPNSPLGSKSVDRFFEAVIFEDVANSATSSLYDNISTYYNF